MSAEEVQQDRLRARIVSQVQRLASRVEQLAAILGPLSDDSPQLEFVHGALTSYSKEMGMKATGFPPPAKQGGKQKPRR